jgi:transposase
MHSLPKVLQSLNCNVHIWVPLLNFKFRLYPTKEQELALEQTPDSCRWVYNSALNHMHNGLPLLFLPAERRESTPVEIVQRSEKQEATVLYSRSKLQRTYHPDYPEVL